MKIKIIRSKFLEGLKKVQNIVATKGSLQIIQNVLLEAKDRKLRLTTTDLDISIRTEVTCEVLTEGSTTLPVKLLFGTISHLHEGPVEIDVNAQDLAVISSGSAVFRLQGMPIADFPTLPEEKNPFFYSLQQITLREMLRKTSFAASQDDTRRTLKGVFMSFKEGKLTMVATDGRRLSLVEHEIDFPAEAERDIVLPMKVVAELQRSLSSEGEVKITAEKTQIAFDMGETRMYSKLLDEIYPNYRQVIPNNCVERVLIDRKSLLDALDRVSVMNSDDSSSTRLHFEPNQLVISTAAASAGDARDLVPIKYSGSVIDISFNPNFVMDPLKAIDDDEIAIELSSGSFPAMIKCSEPFLYVMMPLRTN